MGEIALALIFVIPAIYCVIGLVKASRPPAPQPEEPEELTLASFNRYRDWN